MKRLLRRKLHWKFVFYELLLPLLRLLGPAGCDRALCTLGRASGSLWPGWKRRLIGGLRTACEALDLDESIEHLWPDLAAGTARFLARDCTLEGRTSPPALDRFEVRGYDHLISAIADGRGAILVGSHMGAYIAGLHWLFRRGLPVGPWSSDRPISLPPSQGFSTRRKALFLRPGSFYIEICLVRVRLNFWFEPAWPCRTAWHCTCAETSPGTA